MKTPEEKPPTPTYKTFIPPSQRSFPIMGHKPLIPIISKDAKQAAIEINLPDIKTKMKRTEEWILAFKWYNKYVHKGSHPLGFGCHPCWDKVYNALRKAKEKEDQINKT